MHNRQYAINRAIELRSNGLKWKQVVATIYNEGYRTKNDTAYSIAYLNSMVSRRKTKIKKGLLKNKIEKKPSSEQALIALLTFAIKTDISANKKIKLIESIIENI